MSDDLSAVPLEIAQANVLAWPLQHLDSVRANQQASLGHPHKFEPDSNALSGKVVVLVGGGPTPSVNETIARLAEKACVVTVGSAAVRLDKQAQIAANRPYLDTAHMVVLWNIADNTEDFKVYYARVARIVPEGCPVFVSSTNGPLAYEALPNAVRVDAMVGGSALNDEDSLGLGSAAPSAALMIAMMRGGVDFQFHGVHGGVVKLLPDKPEAELQVVFAEASDGYGAELNNWYPDYNLPSVWTSVSEDRRLVVRIGERSIAVISDDQWRVLEEMHRLVEWGRQNGRTFQFDGDNTLMKSVLDQGMTAVMVFDPSGTIPTGTRIEGLKAESQGLDPELDLVR